MLPMPTELEQCFRQRAEAYFARHPERRAEWRTVKSSVAGDRVDLRLISAAGDEVWATLRPEAIAVGRGANHQDFESFGERLTAEELAGRAFALFRDLVEGRTDLDPEQPGTSVTE